MTAALKSAAAVIGRSVAVKVPATTANLGPGFDTLGLALSLYDELEFTARSKPGATVHVEGIGVGEVPTDETSLVIRAAKHTFEAYGYEMPGLDVVARNGIPHGRGLGSSGAAIVAGVMAAKGLLEGLVEIDSDGLLARATEMEGHPDNVAPALFGGLTIAWTTPEGPRHKKLIVHRGVSPFVAVPRESEMSTALARSLQPESVPHEDAIFNVSRSALLIAALIQSPELLLAATEDKLHQKLSRERDARDGCPHPGAAGERSGGRRVGCRALDSRARQRPRTAARRDRTGQRERHHSVGLPAAGRGFQGCYSGTAVHRGRGLSPPDVLRIPPRFPLSPPSPRNCARTGLSKRTEPRNVLCPGRKDTLTRD